MDPAINLLVAASADAVLSKLGLSWLNTKMRIAYLEQVILILQKNLIVLRHRASDARDGNGSLTINQGEEK